MTTKTRFHLALAAVITWGVAFVIVAQEPKEFRTWTDATGEFKIEAHFEKFEEGKVHLRRKDNDKVVVLPTSKLSKEDQTYFRKLLADRAKAKRSAPSTSSLDKSAATVTPGEKMSWQGTWNNRKYGTEGPLKCTATVKDETTWEAKFDGMGLGRPFAYDATMKVSKKDNRTLLEGTSTVSGDSYQWTGSVEGDTLLGRYRSASGNNGEFRLTKPREQAASKRS